MYVNRRSTGIFFGWWIVAASFLMSAYVAGSILIGFTTIFEPIADEMGWSYTQISLAASLRGLEASLLAPLSGTLADRWGPRKLMLGGTVIIALALILLNYTNSLAMFYSAFFLMALGLSGCSYTVMMTAIANWFRSKMAMASGIVSAGWGFGGFLVPVMLRLIELYEWRLTMTIVALGMLVTFLPLSLLYRHKPEQYGYLPDGQVEGMVPSDKDMGPSQVVEADINTRQALKSSTFWRMALAFALLHSAINAVTTHVMPYLSSVGIARLRSGLIATAVPLISIIGRLSIGWLADRLDRRRVAAGTYLMMGLGLVCFNYASSASTGLLLPFLVLFSIGFGGGNALRPALGREYFGRANFGSVFGFIVGITMLGSITGAPIAGWIYDTWGSYQGIWLFFAILTIVSTILILSISQVRTADESADNGQTN